MTYATKKIQYILITTLAIVAIVLPSSKVYASNYEAQKMVAAKPVASLNQLENYTYNIGFKNVGPTSWTSSGSNKVTIKTTEPVRYEHWFASPSWINKTTVTLLTPATVKNGEVGFFNLVLKAPTKTGNYENKFAVFYGDKKINGTDFSIPITVGNKKNSTTQTATSTKTVTSTATTTGPQKLKKTSLVKGQLMIKSAESLIINPSQTSSFTIGFKNTGERNWRNDKPSLLTLNLDQNSTNGIIFNDSGWISTDIVTKLQTKLTKPGELALFTFTIKAPDTSGQYSPSFYLTLNNDTLVDGTIFNLPIEVSTPPPPVQLTDNNTSVVICMAAEEQNLESIGNETGLCQPAHSEPMMRVGLSKLDGQLGVTSDQNYSITDDTGKLYLNMGGGLTTFLAYDKVTKLYTAVGLGPIIQSSLPLKIKAMADPSIITLTTFSNPVAYNAGWNDNSYRGAIEIRWSKNDEAVWIINELPMEEYLRGLAESSNAAEPEYQKALVTAARSYALYHHQTKAKHAKRYFDVVATVSDQYYRGYESEKRLSKVVAAVDATKGQVVTYNGNVAITPYSASTDGMTKAWEDVWGGTPKPWLIRKPVPEDANRKKFGHAVGLSQLAANDMAKAGQKYIDILKFFYVGTEVGQWY